MEHIADTATTTETANVICFLSLLFYYPCIVECIKPCLHHFWPCMGWGENVETGRELGTEVLVTLGNDTGSERGDMQR